tara:strand:- start:306099 stop:306584 length:486 start_codon:yes stop_codon:yes gene_type:complete
MFTNKHVIIAMIVAPVLSVLAWFAVGQMTGEKPQAAQEGGSYPLVEKSNCRYTSGACDLANEDVKLRLVYAQGDGGPQMQLSSSVALQGVVLGVAEPGEEGRPAMMRAVDGQGLEWRLALAEMPGEEQRIRLVARAAGSSFFAESGTTFLQLDEDRQHYER